MSTAVPYFNQDGKYMSIEIEIFFIGDRWERLKNSIWRAIQVMFAPCQSQTFPLALILRSKTQRKRKI